MSKAGIEPTVAITNCHITVWASQAFIESVVGVKAILEPTVAVKNCHGAYYTHQKLLPSPL